LANTGRDRSAETGETLRTLREQADQTLDGHRRRLTNIESELNLHFQQITEELARDRVVDEMEIEASQKLQGELRHCREMLTQVEGDLEGLRQEAEESRAQLDERTGELEQLREQLSGETVDHNAHFVEQQEECERLRQQGETSRAECDRLGQDLHQIQETFVQAQRESQSFQEQLSALSVEHGAQLAERTDSQEQLQQQIEEVQAERDRLAEQLEPLREKSREQGDESVRLRGELEAAGQLRDELLSVQKELESQQEQDRETRESLESSKKQLQDAQQKIREIESDKEASPELTSLRAERDGLVTRIEELENIPPGESSTDHQQEISDFERRIEMAIEEVCQLKQDNAALQEQVRCIPDAGPAPVADSGPLDWQAQKAILLAELEAEEHGGVVPERREARTTIEGTISLTDRVMAEKDQEIQQLQKLLGSQPAEGSTAETSSEPHAELFDQDELIQSERARLKQITQEMDAKLREAELEISVKRATLAREQAALQEKLAQLPDEEVVEEEPEISGKPRRRWLSALGLKEDE